jgi:hypothetical protein
MRIIVICIIRIVIIAEPIIKITLRKPRKKNKINTTTIKFKDKNIQRSSNANKSVRRHGSS